jgi:Receptor family ligand binding region
MFTEKSFPHFFRVVPSENEFNPPRLSILRYYNWTRVGTLYQNEAKYSLVRMKHSTLEIRMKCLKSNKAVGIINKWRSKIWHHLRL